MNTGKSPSERRRGAASPRGGAAAAPAPRTEPAPRGAPGDGCRSQAGLRPAPQPCVGPARGHTALHPRVAGGAHPAASLVPAHKTRWTPCGRRSLTDAMGRRGRPSSGCTLAQPSTAATHPTPGPGRPARPPSGCHPPGQAPCPCSESGPSPHVPHAPRLTTMGRVARQGLMPTVVSRCWCGPAGAGGGAQRSPAWRAAAGPSSLGQWRAPGPARGRPPPGAARSHSAPRRGRFLTRGASW